MYSTETQNISSPGKGREGNILSLKSSERMHFSKGACSGFSSGLPHCILLI